MKQALNTKNFWIVNLTLLVLLTMSACNNDKNNNRTSEKIELTKMDSMRDILLYKTLPAKEFNLVLDSLQQFMTDSLIADEKRFPIRESKSSNPDTTLKICSLFSSILNSKDNLLLQTATDSTGLISSFSVVIKGKYGSIVKNGVAANNIEQTNPSAGISSFRMYFKGYGSILPKQSIEDEGEEMIINPSKINTSTSGNVSTGLYVLYGNIQDGCPVILGLVPAPSGIIYLN